MKLYEMNLTEILKGLKFEESKLGTNKLIGNDDDNTRYINGVTYNQYKRMVTFNTEILNKEWSELDSFDYETTELIKNFIVPKIQKAKKRFEEYGF